MSKLIQKVFMITTRVHDNSSYSGHLCTKEQSGADKASMFNKKKRKGKR
jgi:hypothetical protein